MNESGRPSVHSTLGGYGAYKDSEVAWIGEIPAHWSMIPNKYLLQPNRRLVGDQSDKWTLLSLTLKGVILRDMDNPQGKFPASFETYQVVEPNDLVFCLFDVDETPRTVGLSSHTGMVTGAYDVFSVQDATLASYLASLYISLDEHKRLRPLYTGLRKVIPRESFLSTKSPVPPLDEQAAIVKYLAHFDRKIDRFIRSKRRMIELLNEQKQAIIHQAVTKGLDPSVPMKDSGVEWLGEIPAHWEVRPLRQMATVQSGVTLGKDYGSKPLLSRPYLRVANVQAGYLNLDKVTLVDVPKEEIERTSLQVGDVLMTEGGDIDKLGRGAIWRGEVEDCLHQNHVFAVRPKPTILNSEFLVYFMGSPFGRSYFETTAKQTTNLAATNKTTLGRFPIVLPSGNEQEAIVRALSKEIAILNSAATRELQEIDLIREYRTRLTSDVVTGKIDVRVAAATLPGIADGALPPDWADEFYANGHEEADEVAFDN